ncbi:MAG: transposase [Opitutales bacterium]|nr:transposase [Opitutales bacterium]
MPRILRKGACYHVISRVCGRAFLLKDGEKETFRDLLERVCGFCGVKLLTYALMDNHFHLLVQIPASPGDLSDDELRQRARLLYGNERKRQPLSFDRIDRALRAGGEVRLAMRGLLLGRMASLPIFVKILKQRFSLLYNRTHDRVGTLWEGRFRSVLVEDTFASVRAVAAYIDLNPVRAGIVKDTKDYRFSGYGAAMSQSKGINQSPLFQRLAEGREISKEQVAAAYRTYLHATAFAKGGQGAPSEEKLREVLAAGGRIHPGDLLRCRLRYMTTGAIIGTRAFVEGWIARRREKMGRGTKRARPPKETPFPSEDGSGLVCLR